jgi:4-carboxymuconolactone decarboxylase
VMAGQVRDQAAGFQEMLRKLAMIHEGFVQDTARLELDLARAPALDPKTAALVVVGVVVAIGASPACLRWSASRALAAGASADEITDVLLAIAPVAGLGRVVCAAPDLAIGLGYDLEAALMEIDDP